MAFSDAGSAVRESGRGRPTHQRQHRPEHSHRAAGIGTLWLHRVVVTAYSLEVRMIDLAAVQDNPAELQPGSKLQLAVARALVLP